MKKKSAKVWAPKVKLFEKIPIEKIPSTKMQAQFSFFPRSSFLPVHSSKLQVCYCLNIEGNLLFPFGYKKKAAFKLTPPFGYKKNVLPF